MRNIDNTGMKQIYKSKVSLVFIIHDKHCITRSQPESYNAMNSAISRLTSYTIFKNKLTDSLYCDIHRLSQNLELADPERT